MNKLFIINILLLGFFSCTEKKAGNDMMPVWTHEQSTNINKRFADEEEIRIKLFLKTHDNWDVTKTGTGLRYWIYEDVEGPNAEAYDIVDVAFEIRLLNDSLLYKTEKNELSTFEVDKSDVESGIMEGIKYLSENDKAKFIIPSHIAHGLLGDFDKIPPLEVLVVDLELKKIHKK
ncbi:MAG: FKBP-type peptidyl-prolyl cis-trans isomerase [Brumimicrobium sp.]